MAVGVATASGYSSGKPSTLSIPSGYDWWDVPDVWAGNYHSTKQLLAERPLVAIDAPVTDHAAVESVAQLRGVPVEWATGMSPQPSPGRAVLTGVPSGSEFAWTFAHDGRTAGMRGSAEDAVHFASDTLAARYAPASTRSTSS